MHIGALRRFRSNMNIWSRCPGCRNPRCWRTLMWSNPWPKWNSNGALRRHRSWIGFVDWGPTKNHRMGQGESSNGETALKKMETNLFGCFSVFELDHDIFNTPRELREVKLGSNSKRPAIRLFHQDQNLKRQPKRIWQKNGLSTGSVTVV